MVAGVLSETGYHMGDRLIPPDYSNPKGYFEDYEINDINEELLSPVLPYRPKGIVGSVLFRSRLGYGQKWLAALPTTTRIPIRNGIVERIKRATSVKPYCYKDPRFSYTLSVWRPYVDDCIFLCVFREPSKTAVSIVDECKRKDYLRNLDMNYDRALETWEAIYKYILEVDYVEGGQWLFLNYNQFLDGSAFEKIRKTLQVEPKRNFVSADLDRSKGTSHTPDKIKNLYERLCTLADYNGA